MSMRTERLRIWLIAAAALATAAPSAPLPEPTPAEIERNRQRLEQKTPEQLKKLREEAQAFFALPEARQKQIAGLHQALKQEPPPVQRRLSDVLERYVDWLEKLDDKARQRIAAAPDPRARLAVIQELRAREWIDKQPKAIQEEIAALTGEAKQRRITELKADEQQRRIEWTIAQRFWNELESKSRLPLRVEDFPQTPREPARDYAREYLLRFLSPAEHERLDRARGEWPEFPMALMELAEKHPAALPGPHGPASVAELPAEIRALLSKDLVPKAKKENPAWLARRLPDAPWPEFGARLAKHAKERGLVYPHEFLAYSKNCLLPPMREFIDKTLMPVLSADEKVRLADATVNARWPEFPQTIQELADNHYLRPPWFVFPRWEYWGNYRLHR